MDAQILANPNRINGRPGLNMATKPCNPLSRTHAIPITVKRWYTTVDGKLINKALAPAAFKVELPFFVFGYFDFKGGYNTGLRAMPVLPGSFYLMSFIEGAGLTSQQITGFTGLNDVRTKIKTGDIVHVFTDNLTTPNCFAWIVLSSRNGSLGSIASNSDGFQMDGQIGPLFVDHFQYFSDNAAEQWNLPFHFTRSSNIAAYKDDQVQPYMFRNPYTEQQGFTRIECKFNLDQYQSVGTYFLFATDEIQLVFSLLTN